MKEIMIPREWLERLINVAKDVPINGEVSWQTLRLLGYIESAEMLLKKI